MPNICCPLCDSSLCHVFFSDKHRDYFRCRICSLVFVASHQHLSLAAEKAIYDLHQNHLNDSGYQRFLSRLLEPMLNKLPKPASGLDFGCGSGPLLAEMFKQHGHQIKLFDPFYACQPQNLQQSYDFITCTEVVEHLREPKTSWHQLFAMLKADGVLGVMTKLVIDAEAFAKWHYKNDPTHISFYSRPTLNWLAKRYDYELEIIGNDVILFTAKS